MRSRLLLSCALLLAGCLTWIRGAAELPKQTQNLPILYTSAANYKPLAWLRGGERFPQGGSLMVIDGASSRRLVPRFAASVDAAVSFDGSRVLFAGKRSPSDRWQIWEIPVNGGQARQITSCTGNCVRPFYLPADRVVYAREVDGRYVLETALLDGTSALQLTHVPGNALPTDVLRDGRVLFEAAYPLGSGTTSELYTVYTDGSGVEAYRCDHAASRSEGKQVASGDIVFVKNATPARFTSALAHDVPASPVTGEIAGEIAERSEAEWIVAARPDAGSRYSLRVCNVPAGTSATLIADANANLVQPVVLAPHDVPKTHPSGLHDWQVANLLCLNAYTSKYEFAKGSIASVRVYTQAANGKAKLLGTAPVEPDGSFFVQVSGDQPLQFELLDHAGKTLKREQGWWWARKGEQRVCVGCHAGPERAPDNAVPAVLSKSTDPVALLGEPARGHAGGH